MFLIHSGTLHHDYPYLHSVCYYFLAEEMELPPTYSDEEEEEDEDENTDDKLKGKEED